MSESVDNLRMEFVQKFGLKVFNREPEVRLILIPQKTGEKKFLFETESLFLDSCPYEVKITDGKGNNIFEGINIEVYDGYKKIPRKIAFIEANNPRSNFPGGSFLVIRPQSSEFPNKPLSLTTDRLILEDIDRGYLFKGQDFKKVVSGKKKWCLLPDE